MPPLMPETVYVGDGSDGGGDSGRAVACGWPKHTGVLHLLRANDLSVLWFTSVQDKKPLARP